MICTAPLTTPSTMARAAWIITFTLANVLVACTPEYRMRLNPLGSVCCTYVAKSTMWREGHTERFHRTIGICFATIVDHGLGDGKPRKTVRSRSLYATEVRVTLHIAWMRAHN